MKVMHLADLHLGKVILEQSMIEDQKYILAQIIDIIKLKEIDLVLIAGDVYDKGIPNIEAVHLFNDFLNRLYQLKVKVFVISGNHDSKDRLSFGNELFSLSNIFIETIYKGFVKCVKLEDEYGEFNVYMLPFIKPLDVRLYHSSEDINSYQSALECVMKNTSIDFSKRNIILVHQFVTASGVELVRSDSENISLGGIDNVDVSLFDGFDYVAMGHIHRAQKLMKDTIRYAGSPLKYSFSEVNQKKSVPIIVFGEKGDIDIELVPLEPIRDMRIIRGKLFDLLDNEIINMGNIDDYIGVILTDEDYLMDAVGKLRKVYKNLLRLEYHNKRSIGNYDENDITIDDMEKKSEVELFLDFYKKQNGIELNDERLKIIKKVIQDVKELE